MEQQLQTSLYGPMIVTRSVVPLMRKQGSGHIISISSTAGLASYSSVVPILLLNSESKDGCKHCRLK
ncbi:SDR family NAD(P)-dependent oxidoreductase [Segetibacter koreensis]|uniref:SDR family NAD(P)-dependent oxidoreductase n=1 Tax=Segetibacter koreensis TaxID=398037 RepID=UPI003CCC2674